MEKCPYCEKEIDICYKGDGVKQDILHQKQCSHCEKYFVFTTEIIFHHALYKADCLNGKDHKWLLIINGNGKYICSDCGEVKETE